MIGNNVALLSAAAMLFFAANSLLCRMAIAPGLIDPISFSTVRVLAAIAVLSLVVVFRRGRWPKLGYAKLKSVSALFAYLVTFPLAYERLGAGIGAIVLFAVVQFTMFAVALYEGERFTHVAWLGLAASGTALVFLMLPSGGSGDPLGLALMTICGVAWGGFCLLARDVDHPVEANASNFIFCLPLILVANVTDLSNISVTAEGLWLAVAAGGVATAIGYIVWYQAIKLLSASRAAVVQLSVPVLAAIGGAVFLSETLALQSIIASIVVLGGIGVVLSQ